MFCYLYIMSDGTSISLHENEKCFEECKYCTENNECSLYELKDENLTEDHYGWILQHLLFFENPFSSNSGNTKYFSAILLIHPSSPNLWIVKCERFNKETEDWVIVYRLHKNNECLEFDDLKSLNQYIKKRLKYNGRKIKQNDLERDDK